ncbi:MAG: 4'-phosphopantetheinyl transferase superfamily protein [Cyanobacteria bacterium RI_101]|nr:4'-phosphopantetheinyl transferase superfamily protein [Cyanobacteria bacterium RI_101]
MSQSYGMSAIPKGEPEAPDRQNQIALWRFPLDLDPKQIEDCERLLTPEEEAQVKTLRRPEDRKRAVATRASLRLILAAALRCDPGDIRYQRTERGKPYLDPRRHGENLQFNLSHSGAWGLAALAQGIPLGVDLEVRRPLTDVLALARRFFSPREYQTLAQAAPAERERRFLEYWTAKEAYLKATGEGLSAGLASVEVDLQRGSFVGLPPEPPWQLVRGYLELDAPWALAYPGAERPWRLSPFVMG